MFSCSYILYSRQFIRIILPHNLSPITLNLEQEDKVKSVPAKLISGGANLSRNSLLAEKSINQI